LTNLPIGSIEVSFMPPQELTDFPPITPDEVICQMPSILPRAPFRRAEPETEEPLQSVAAVIADLESRVGQSQGDISHREFRELVRERARSHEEAWMPIRNAALGRGLR
jgi:hypothetical protein